MSGFQFLWLNSVPLCTCTSFSYHQWMDTGGFYLFSGYFEQCWNVHKSADSFQHNDLISFSYVLSSGFAGSYSSSIMTFLRKFHSVLHNGFTNLAASD